MQQTIKTIQFPASTNLGELYLVDANRLPEVYKRNYALSIEHTPLGRAQGKRMLSIGHDQKLLLEIDEKTFREENLIECNGLEAIDIVSGVKDDDQLSAVAQCLSQLRGLILPGGIRKISTDGYAAISKLPQLEYLNIAASQYAVTDEGERAKLPADCLAGLANLKMVVFPSISCLQFLKDVPGIETIVVDNQSEWTSKYSTAFWQQLLNMRRLKKFSLKSAVGDNPLETLASIDGLESLVLGCGVWSHFRTGFEKCLSKMCNLRRLKMCCEDVDAVNCFLQNSNLEDLELESFPLTEEAMLMLCRLSNLRKLTISNDHFGVERRLLDESLAGLAKLSELESLTLRDVHLSLKKLEELKQLKNLKSLDFVRTDLTDDHLACLSQFPNLRSLNISKNERISSSGLQYLRGLPLEALHLRENKNCNTVEAVNQIACLIQLRTLNLNDVGIDNFGLSQLARLHNLETLDIGVRCTHPSVCKVTNEGVAALLRLRKLKEINLENQQGVNDDVISILSGFSCLSKARVDCTRVSRKGQGYLRDIVDSLYPFNSDGG